MAIGTKFTITLGFGDSAGPTYTGPTVVSPGTLGNNATQINQELKANAAVVPTAVPNATGQEVPVSNSPITVANITAIGFQCQLVNSNSNANTPVCYVKLKNAISGGKDYIMGPLVPNQTVTYLPLPTKDPNGNTMNTTNQTLDFPVQLTNTLITSITAIPDPTSDLQILGTIEVSL